MSPRRLPAEWEPQSGVMLTWPHIHGVWGRRMETVEHTFVQIAQTIAQREIVLIVCRDETHRGQIQALLKASAVKVENVRLHIAPSDDVWARDHGPITVIENGAPHLLDFIFNGWGNKYAASLDDDITRRLVESGAFGTTLAHKVDVVLEGGSIDSDGAGTILTTSHCLLNPNRNPGLDRRQLEIVFREQFGATRVLWLEHGDLEGDDTDGHVDTLARFCDEHTIAYMACENPADEQYAELKAMENELKALRDAGGAPYRLVPLPSPSPIIDEKQQRLPATYANFLVINDTVLVPTYNDPMDEPALQLIEECFPQRQVVGIDARPLIRQYGSLHCVTMQLPQGIIA
jgi:agmatine deiminase